MKRIEVILLIAECLIDPHFPDDSMKEADYILNRLEKEGMLPPKYDKFYGWTDECSRQVTYYKEVNEWEKE